MWIYKIIFLLKNFRKEKDRCWEYLSIKKIKYDSISEFFLKLKENSYVRMQKIVKIVRNCCVVTSELK